MSTPWYLQTLHIIAEEFTHLNYLELSKKDGCKIIYKYSPFHIDLAIKMAAMLTISIDLLKLKYVSQNIILSDL